jgi:hypothetical protein
MLVVLRFSLCRWLSYRNAAVSHSAATVSDSFSFGLFGAYTVPVTYFPTRTEYRREGGWALRLCHLHAGGPIGTFPRSSGERNGQGVFNVEKLPSVNI